MAAGPKDVTTVGISAAENRDKRVEPPNQPSGVRSAVVRLVREKRYEEALILLYAARADSPGDKDLQASIRQIKEFLVGAYAKRLGGLDRVAGPVPVVAGRSPDALLVARYVDGSSTFDDISRMCPLGRVRTLQVLVELYSTGESPSAPEVEAPVTPAPPGIESEPDTMKARSETTRVSTPKPPQVETQTAPPAAPVSSGDDNRPSYVQAIPAPRAWGALADELKEPEVPNWWRTAGESQRPPPVVSSHFDSTPAPSPTAPASPEEQAYRDAFARGTQAFVQRRFADAADSFRECDRLRPGDVAANTMLRRALADGRS